MELGKESQKLELAQDQVISQSPTSPSVSEDTDSSWSSGDGRRSFSSGTLLTGDLDLQVIGHFGMK